MPKPEWYAQGLSFECTQCGRCCSGPPGYVWFTDAEARVMAAFVKMELSEFLCRCAHTYDGRWTLNEIVSSGRYDCVFLRRDEQGKAMCAVYPARPAQCRTWPFWKGNLFSPKAWQQAAQRCPGMNQGKHYPLAQIRIARDSNE